MRHAHTHILCPCRCPASLKKRAVAARPSRKACAVYAVAADTQTKTLKIGTRGSPLALAQAYLTRDLLKVWRTMRQPAWLGVRSQQQPLAEEGGGS
jgi:hypothetical protein